MIPTSDDGMLASWRYREQGDYLVPSSLLPCCCLALSRARRLALWSINDRFETVKPETQSLRKNSYCEACNHQQQRKKTHQRQPVEISSVIAGLMSIELNSYARVATHYYGQPSPEAPGLRRPAVDGATIMIVSRAISLEQRPKRDADLAGGRGTRRQIAPHRNAH